MAEHMTTSSYLKYERNLFTALHSNLASLPKSAKSSN